jgi:hypothetical protein
VSGGLVGGPVSEGARDELAARRKMGETALQARFAHARADGELPAETDVDGLSRYFVTVYQGIAVQAAGGASREHLHEIVDFAMRIWPSTED